MTSLPSGLPEIVEDGEEIARFLTQSSHFKKTHVSPSAFLPEKRNRETSVARHGGEPLADLRQIGLAVIAGSDRKLYGAAMILARDVRGEKLEVVAAEPPDKHAVLTGWPWLDNDPADQKAKQLLQALALASAAGVPLLFNDGDAWTSESPTPSPTASPA